MSIFYCDLSNSLQSKKASISQRDIPTMIMNYQYIQILLTFPLRLSASCGRALFVGFSIFPSAAALRPFASIRPSTARSERSNYGEQNFF